MASTSLTSDPFHMHWQKHDLKLEGNMRKNPRIIQIVVCSFMACVLSCSTALADKHKKDKHETESFSSITNNTYRQQCNACHFNYQPGLLPTASWQNILNDLPFHFDEEVSIDENSLSEIRKYLAEHSAENSSSKRARKIIESVNGQTPLRITEIPYILEKHNELGSTIFTRPSIGSKSNCIACHTTAEQGNYDDDNVRIPN